MFIAESDYAHDTEITFQIRDVQALCFTSPTIQNVYAPTHVTLPRTRLAVIYDILGKRTVRKGSHTITVSLTSIDGRTHTKQQQDLANGRIALLDTSTLTPGPYRLNLTITTADDKQCAHETRSIVASKGPIASRVGS